MHVLKLTRRVSVKEIKQKRVAAANKRTAQRLKAIELRVEGKRPPEIAQVLGCHVETVRRWIKLFNREGFAALEFEQSGGPEGKLKKEHEGKLMQWLRDGTPEGGRWTLRALTEKLFEEFDVKISLQQVWQRVNRMGYRGRNDPTRKKSRKKPTA